MRSVPPSHALVALAYLSALSVPLLAQEEYADPAFDTSVATPAYTVAGPTVAIDAPHSNRYTANGGYKALAELLRNDGYTVVSLSTVPFDAAALDEIDVLVMASHLAAEQADEKAETIRNWVDHGGSLLLATDLPFPLGPANLLANGFGVATGTGLVFDREGERRLTTPLTFTRENRLLGDHPIVFGRDASEAVSRVATFTGQSLSVPAGASPLLKLSDTAREAATSNDVSAESVALWDGSTRFGSRSTSVAGRAQGVALTYGMGRVVILGDTAMLEARLHRHPHGEGRVGLNVADNRQFALNVFHWLSGLIG